MTIKRAFTFQFQKSSQLTHTAYGKLMNDYDPKKTKESDNIDSFVDNKKSYQTPTQIPDQAQLPKIVPREEDYEFPEFIPTSWNRFPFKGHVVETALISKHNPDLDLHKNYNQSLAEKNAVSFCSMAKTSEYNVMKPKEKDELIIPIDLCMPILE